MSFSRLANFLWAAGFLGNAGLLTVLVVKKRWKQFPVFTGISSLHFLRTITLFCLSRYALTKPYYWVYWTCAAVELLLQVLLLLELANGSLRRKGTLWPAFRSSVLTFALTGLSLAAIASVAASPPLTDEWDLWEMRISLFTALLMCELCVALSALANRLGLQWRTHSLAIAQGYTAWATCCVVGNALHAATGWHRDFAVFDYIRMFVYVAALLYWTRALATDEERKPVPDLNLIRSISGTFARGTKQR